MEWWTAVGYGAGFGLVLSVWFTVAVFVGAAISRDFLLNDYPPAVQQRYGKPKSQRGKRVAVAFGIVVWGLGGLPLITIAMITLNAALDGGLGFVSAAVCAAVLFATLTLYDLVVLDWIVLAGLRPTLLMLPGTEDMPEYRDLRFHLDAAIKGSPVIVVVGLIAGSVSMLFL